MDEQPANEEVARENAVLGALPANELAQVMAVGEIVDNAVRDMVYAAGTAIEHVFFPIRAVFSMVSVVRAEAPESRVEVGTIGREAFVGLPVFLGASSSPHETFCQVSGLSVRLRADDFRALSTNGSLHSVLQRSVQVTIVQLAQNAACNIAHSTDQRASRWLLMTHDRVARDTFPLTHEFLGQMLGVRRATVTETARRLQAAGLVSYRRGVMTITDRRGLESRACECYGIIRREFDALVR